MQPYLINQSDVPWDEDHHGDHAIDERDVSLRLRARKLSYGLTRIPPGKKSYPLHFHHDNEELFVILEGTGRLRYGDGEESVRAGDVIACPPGPQSAHQFINDGTEPLVYLALGSMHAPEVSEYPESGKFNVMVGEAAGGHKDKRPFAGYFFKDSAVGYWEGEA